jgi:hypothetical protein
MVVRNLPKASSRSLRQLTKQNLGRYSDSLTYLNELNDFEASLVSFIFGNKRLVTA